MLEADHTSLYGAPRGVINWSDVSHLPILIITLQKSHVGFFQCLSQDLLFLPTKSVFFGLLGLVLRSSDLFLIQV